MEDANCAGNGFANPGCQTDYRSSRFQSDRSVHRSLIRRRFRFWPSNQTALIARSPLAFRCKAPFGFTFKFLPDEDVAQVLRTVQESLKEFQLNDPFYRTYPISWKPFYDPPLLGHERSESHGWTKCLASAVSGVCAKEVTVAAGVYPCDAFLLQREFGIPTLLFGPSGAGAHNPDEYVELDSILRTA
jgi:hypothetical protein